MHSAESEEIRDEMLPKSMRGRAFKGLMVRASKEVARLVKYSGGDEWMVVCVHTCLNVALHAGEGVTCLYLCVYTQGGFGGPRKSCMRTNVETEVLVTSPISTTGRAHKQKRVSSLVFVLFFFLMNKISEQKSGNITRRF